MAILEGFPGENPEWYGGYDDDGYPHTLSSPGIIPLDPYTRLHEITDDTGGDAVRPNGIRFAGHDTPDGELGHTSQETGA